MANTRIEPSLMHVSLSQAYLYNISYSSPPYLRYSPRSSSTHARYLAATCALLVRSITEHLPNIYRTSTGHILDLDIG